VQSGVPDLLVRILQGGEHPRRDRPVELVVIKQPARTEPHRRVGIGDGVDERGLVGMRLEEKPWIFHDDLRGTTMAPPRRTSRLPR
jgi:hypothetical protein